MREEKTTKKLFWSRVALAGVMIVLILWNTKDFVNDGETSRAVMNLVAGLGILGLAILGDLQHEKERR